jgi:hypothetical protein
MRPTSPAAASASAVSWTYGRASIRRAAAPIRSWDLELIATRAPSCASAVATPRPSLFDAPVTSATLPSMPRSIAVGDPTGRSTIRPDGRLAQLVERLPYKQEVACSSQAPPIF